MKLFGRAETAKELLVQWLLAAAMAIGYGMLFPDRQTFAAFLLLVVTIGGLFGYAFRRNRRQNASRKDD
ncbi:hypothetical protein KUV47_12350 [Vannielia litorea]|uniref:hypothetical protein n=1 Tax=Vannielia litorea TaxID=1217970 RepID=UPI001C980D7F|nr:hypothetical protein [Vannielia litorea]MBY6154007.1 hypothetical protein [Vannielia litorea]